MKRLLVLLCILFTFTGCTGHDIDHVSTEKPAEETAPALSVPVYSQEQAMIEGFLVMQLGDVRYNQQNWFDCLEKAHAGEQTQLNVIHFFDKGSGWGQILYELSFDGVNYTVCYQQNGETVTETASALMEESGVLDETAEPYDAFHRFSLNGLVLYEDLIIIPEFCSDVPISLHAKEGDPALRDYTSPEDVIPIVKLLSDAEYLPCEPVDYLYGMKLLTADEAGDGIVIELDLRYGNYRYGTQVFHYGDVESLFEALHIDGWPDSALAEYKDFLD